MCTVQPRKQSLCPKAVLTPCEFPESSRRIGTCSSYDEPPPWFSVGKVRTEHWGTGSKGRVHLLAWRSFGKDWRFGPLGGCSQSLWLSDEETPVRLCWWSGIISGMRALVEGCHRCCQIWFDLSEVGISHLLVLCITNNIPSSAHILYEQKEKKRELYEFLKLCGSFVALSCSTTFMHHGVPHLGNGVVLPAIYNH